MLQANKYQALNELLQKELVLLKDEEYGRTIKYDPYSFAETCLKLVFGQDVLRHSDLKEFQGTFIDVFYEIVFSGEAENMYKDARKFAQFLTDIGSYNSFILDADSFLNIMLRKTQEIFPHYYEGVCSINNLKLAYGM